MALIDMSDYNRRARCYWWLTTLIGTAATAFSVYSCVGMDRRSLLELALYMGAVIVASSVPISIPGTQNSATPSDVFVFLSALSLGPHAATIVAVTDALAGSLRMSRRLTSRVGGPAMMAIAMFGSASLFRLMLERRDEFGLNGPTPLLAALLLFALVYFALNTLLLAANLAFKKEKPLFRLWWQNYWWISLPCTASASVAGLIFLAVQRSGVMPVLAAGPLIAVIVVTFHFYFKQAEERARAGERISNLHLATVEALAIAINAKDEITNDHVYRVQVYACGLAKLFNLGEPEIEALKAGALLHDVGKIAVPDYVLNKPGKLTAAEFDKMKIHTVVGAQILERVDFPYPVVPIVRHHHERWDGRGYPDGLAGDQIPVTARILSVVDCFDAVREDRQYRKGLNRDEACQLLRDGAGTQFDPAVVDTFLGALEGFEKEIAEHKSNRYPMLTPSTQPGLSKTALAAKPAAGLEQSPEMVPDYVKHIYAAHAEVGALYDLAQGFS